MIPRGAVVTLALSAALFACGDSGPQGPGSFDASLQIVGPPAGGVVVDVTGAGVSGIEEQGDTRVFTNPITGGYRVIAVSGTGAITFQVNVDRVEAGFPAAVVVDATGTDNGTRGPAGISVVFQD